MTDQNLDWRARIRAPASRGPTSGCNSERGIFQLQPQASMEFQRLTSLARVSPSSTIMSRFESPASAFYAAERCMGFPQYESGNFSQLSGDTYAFESPGFGFGNSIQSAAKPNDDVSAMFGHEHRIGTDSSAISINPILNHDIAGYGGSFGSPFSQVSFASSQRLETQLPRPSPGNCASMSSMSTNSATIASKSRIRWNQELHEKFVECVHRLGGADKATPKAILKLMDSEGVTIFHVKSHLQKYRIAKYLPDSIEGKSEKRAFASTTTELEATTGMQIKEALQLQLDVQRRLHEQLEIQRKLQLQIEEQGKQLKMMFDIQQRTSNNFLNSQSSEVSSLEEAPSNNVIETTNLPPR